jgi:hypothetical protein
MWLITFDIDGTMEFGEPKGLLTREHIEYFRSHGALIGSASDRPQSSQERMWTEYGVTPDFYVMKHRMGELKRRHPDAHTFWHVGDRPVDQKTAQAAGFTFFWPDQFPSPEMGEGFLPKRGPDGSQTLAQTSLAEAALKLALHALSGDGKNADAVPSAYDDPYASGGRVPGDDLGTAFPI